MTGVPVPPRRDLTNGEFVLFILVVLFLAWFAR